MGSRRRRFVVPFLIAMVALLLWSGSAFAQSVTISGTVFGDGAPMNGVHVEVLAGATVIASTDTTTVSGQVGSYSLTFQAGTYNIRATPPATSTVRPGTLTGESITANRTIQIFLFSPAAAGQITGTVKKADGTPLVNNPSQNHYVNVYLYDLQGQQVGSNVTTDASGAFKFTSVGSSKYRVYVNWYFYDQTIGRWNYRDYYTTSNQSLMKPAGGSFDLSLPVYTVSGKVSAPSGAAVSGASVYLYGYGQEPDGTYWYTQSYGLSSTSGSYSVSTMKMTRMDDATVTPPASATEVAMLKPTRFQILGDLTQDFTLPVAAGITGVVRDLDGHPMPEVRLYCINWDSGSWLDGSVVTDANGAYTWKVGDGSYYFYFECYNRYMQYFYGYWAEKIVVTGTAQVFDIRLPVFSYTGKVYGADLQPMAGAQVRLYGQGQKTGNPASRTTQWYFYTTATTGADGSYTLKVLPTQYATSPNSTSHYTTFSILPPAQDATSGHLFANGLPEMIREPAPGDATPVHDFALPQAAYLTGTVKNASGDVLSGVQVNVNVPNHGLGTVYTGADGKYSFKLSSASNYNVYFYKGNAPAAKTPQYFEYYPNQQITVNGDTRLDVNVPTAAITLSVTDQNGAPVPSTQSYSYNSRGVTVGNQNWYLYYYNYANTAANGKVDYVILRGDGNRFEFTPPSSSGFTKRVIPSAGVSGDQLQVIALELPDTKPPQIVSGPSIVYLSDESVAVNFVTNEAASALVQVRRPGETAWSGEVATTGLRTRHSVTLADLVPTRRDGSGAIVESSYEYRVSATDGAIPPNSSDWTAPRAFTMKLEPGDFLPPVITSGPAATYVDDVSAIIGWKTDEVATSVVTIARTIAELDARSGPSFRSVTSDVAERDHALAVAGLAPNTAYVARVESTDPDRNGPTVGPLAGVLAFSTLKERDKTAPAIVDGPRASAVTDTQATIEWRTDEAADGGVSFNDGSRFDLVNDAETFTPAHSFVLSGLAPSTTYNVRVSSKDLAGNGPTVSGTFTFRTAAARDTTAPAITGVTLTGTTSDGATVGWTTSEPATSIVEVRKAAPPGQPFEQTVSVELRTAHALSLSNLEAGTAYEVRVRSSDASGNEQTSAVLGFATKAGNAPPAGAAASYEVENDGVLRFTLAGTDQDGDPLSFAWKTAPVGGNISGTAPSVTYTPRPDFVGTETLQYFVSDGRAASQPATVTIEVKSSPDRFAPVIVPPADMTVEATGPSGAVVTFLPPAVTDNRDPAPAVSLSASSGDTFPLGATEVTISATDAAGNVGTGKFHITVRDTKAPSITGPASKVVDATSAAGAVVEFAAATASDTVDTSVQVTVNKASGSTFAIGVTTVRFTATDASGNQADYTFTIEVKDRQPPQITSKPADVEGLADGPSGKTISFTPAQATDFTPVTFSYNFTAGGQPRTANPAGTLFPIGTTTVTIVARDLFGNQSTDTFQVRVFEDSTPPSAPGRPVPSANPSATGTLTITWGAATDALTGVSGYDVLVGGAVVGSVGGGATSYTLSGLSEGTYAVEVRAKDGASTPNTATSESLTLVVDRTGPVITVTPSRSANAAGWYNADVTFTFAAQDALSGVDAGSVSAPVTISTEGVGVSVSANARDLAGNAATLVFTINLDKTPPAIAAAADRAPNANGWYAADVTVGFTASDAGSGVAGAPSSVVLSAEGADVRASASATDAAGNTAEATLSVKIDKTAPQVTASPDRAPNASGWYRSDVTVTFAAQDGLSGVASSSPAQTLSAEGAAVCAQGEAVDLAGNRGTASFAAKIDRTPPSVSAAPDRAPNANGWYNADVTVQFTASDALSGGATTPATRVISQEGAAAEVVGTVTDLAGNTASASYTVRLDKTPPQLTATPDRAPNASGWYNRDVTVTFGATDALSGVASSSAPRTLSAEGAAVCAQGDAVDLAGNRATAAFQAKIDRTPPQVTATPDRAPNANGWYNANVVVTFAAADALSGAAAPASRTISQEGAASQVSATVCDLAGNQASVSLTVRLDKTAPAIQGVPDRAPNADGWYAADVTVSFPASDALSGLASSSAPVRVTGEGAALSARGAAADLAGNVATACTNVKIDRTRPTLAARVPPANARGWYRSDVTIGFDAADALSGIAAPPAPVTLHEGVNQSVTATVRDRAGNLSSVVVTGINVDETAPAATLYQSTRYLWPVNRKAVPVLLFGRMRDGSGIASATIEVTSSDPDAGTERQDVAGDINGRAGPVQVAPTSLGNNGLFLALVTLRAERAPGNAPRTYTVRLAVTDLAGNVTTIVTTVIVPRNNPSNDRDDQVGDCDDWQDHWFNRHGHRRGDRCRWDRDEDRDDDDDHHRGDCDRGHGWGRGSGWGWGWGDDGHDDGHDGHGDGHDGHGNGHDGHNDGHDGRDDDQGWGWGWWPW